MYVCSGSIGRKFHHRTSLLEQLPLTAVFNWVANFSFYVHQS